MLVLLQTIPGLHPAGVLRTSRFVPDESVAVHQGAGAPADRVRWYRDALDDLTSELDALLARVDGLLDPSTTRTAELVQHDLTQLRDQLGGRRIGR